MGKVIKRKREEGHGVPAATKMGEPIAKRTRSAQESTNPQASMTPQGTGQGSSSTPQERGARTRSRAQKAREEHVETRKPFKAKQKLTRGLQMGSATAPTTLYMSSKKKLGETQEKSDPKGKGKAGKKEKQAKPKKVLNDQVSFLSADPQDSYGPNVHTFEVKKKYQVIDFSKMDDLQPIYTKLNNDNEEELLDILERKAQIEVDETGTIAKVGNFLTIGLKDDVKLAEWFKDQGLHGWRGQLDSVEEFMLTNPSQLVLKNIGKL